MTTSVMLSKTAKLNVFALPNYTSFLFFLMFLVIGIIFTTALFGATPIGESSLICSASFLIVYFFLRWPDRKIEKADMQPLDKHYPDLASYIVNLIKELNPKRQPKLFWSNKPGVGLQAFGTLRRNYLIIPDEWASELDAGVKSENHIKKREAESILFHELSHFKNKDIFPGLFSGWILLILVFFFLSDFFLDIINSFAVQGLLNYPYLGMFLPDAFEIAKVLDPESAIIFDNPLNSFPIRSSYLLYSLSTGLPLVFGSSILLLWLWRAILKTREFYADARTAQQQGNNETLSNVLLLLWDRSRTSHQPSRYWVQRKWHGVKKYWHFVTERLFHPNIDERHDCLNWPHKMYGDEKSVMRTFYWTPKSV